MKELNIKVRFASGERELLEVCKLNHQTFAEEIPQHHANDSGILIDKFHEENRYLICLLENEIIAMLALRANRPFSLDCKLENLNNYLPPHKSLCEIRLLSIKPAFRGTQIFYLLFKEAFAQVIKEQYDYLLICGVLAQQKLYRSLGFVPFGPLVGDEVKFQPMYASPQFFFQSRHQTIASKLKNNRLNLLPGPVDISKMVISKFTETPDSHRGTTFTENYASITSAICQMVNCKKVQIFTGSGTFGNEIMLAHIATLQGQGLILANGEFGNRIIAQAQCYQLDFITFTKNLGDVIEPKEVEAVLSTNPQIKWLYFVHCETSSGVMNNMLELLTICTKLKILVFVDCVSTFGIIPIDLEGVYMASASSGKAIGSLSGLSLVFYNELLPANNQPIPMYINLRLYEKKNGIPFTINSNAMYALGMAVSLNNAASNYKMLLEESSWLRTQCNALGLQSENVPNRYLHPAIITLTLSKNLLSSNIGKELELNNIHINYNSDYLLQKNMIQICLFSPFTHQDLIGFMENFKKLVDQV